MLPWLKLALIAAVLALLAGSYWWTYTEGEAAGANRKAAEFAQAQDIAIKARDAEQARIEREQQDAALRGQKARDDAELARAAADDAVARLRQRARELAARACPGAAAATNGAPAGTGSELDLLADVPGRLAAAGRELAAFAQASRIAGTECQQRYDATRAASERAEPVAP